MKEKKRSKYFIAHLLLIVFVGITLTKPVHLLFDHYPHDISHPEHSGEHSHDNCTICQFSFFASTEPEAAAVLIVCNHLTAKLENYQTVIFSDSSQKHIIPRAPPAA